MVEEAQDNTWNIGVDSSDSDSFTVVVGGAANSAVTIDSDGSLAMPSYTFSNDTDTGFYRISSGEWQEHRIKERMQGLQNKYLKSQLDRKELVKEFEKCYIDQLSQVELLEQWDDYKEKVKDETTLTPPEIKYQTNLPHEERAIGIGFTTSVQSVPTP